MISVAYTPLVSPLAPKTCEDLPALSEESSFQFTSKIEYETAVPGMVLKTILPNYQPPPGLKFIPGKKKGSAMGGASAGGGSDAKPEGFGNTKEEKEMPTGIGGFFQRYWYIILPIVLMNLMADPQQQQQQQQQGGGGGSAAGGGQPAAAAAPASGGSPSKRRGKRG